MGFNLRKLALATALSATLGGPACSEKKPQSVWIVNPNIECPNGIAKTASYDAYGEIVLRCQQSTGSQITDVIQSTSDTTPTPPETHSSSDSSLDSTTAPEDSTDTISDTTITIESAPETNLSPLPEIISNYQKILGPGHHQLGFYYIDFSTFRIFGPYTPDSWDNPDSTAIDKYHDKNRLALQDQHDEITVDTKADFPVPIVIGHRDYKYEDIIQKRNRPHQGTTLYQFVQKTLNESYATSSLATTFSPEDSEYFKNLILKGLIAVESGWRTDATSPNGATGLLQIMPDSQKLLEQKGYIEKNLNLRNPQNAVKIALSLFKYHIDYIKEKVGADHFIFKPENARTIFIPLLITSYNQGQGRMLNIVQYLDNLNAKAKIPSHLYQDKDNSILNEETIIWLFSRYFNTQNNPSEIENLDATDTNFATQNRAMKDHGMQYFLKILALSSLSETNINSIFEQLTTATPGLAQFPNIKVPNNAKIEQFIKNHPSQNQKAILDKVRRDKEMFEQMRFTTTTGSASLGSIGTMEELIDYLDKNPDRFSWPEEEGMHYLAFDHGEIPQTARRVLRKSQLPTIQELYLNLNRILTEAGLPEDHFCVPIINSTVRSRVNNAGQPSASPTSFHLSLNAIDLNQYKFRVFRKTEDEWVYQDQKMSTAFLNALQQALYQHAQQGDIAVRFHGGHGHLVLFPSPLQTVAPASEQPQHIAIRIGHRRLIDALIDANIKIPGFDYTKTHDRKYKTQFARSQQYRLWIRALKKADSGNPHKTYRSGDTIKVDKSHRR
ncbi:hypothetical protein CVV38_01065 [Candidatus Peregrinibacteria bacterium HGW-Peregrinibacteria-1]|jgi:hypothetical protein|nr:MAG: hypothetical protein CVV38_01065 [Candidatus Peregrinibacteria bacterium HGW-Peregrinibacteria-1]